MIRPRVARLTLGFAAGALTACNLLVHVPEFGDVAQGGAGGGGSGGGGPLVFRDDKQSDFEAGTMQATAWAPSSALGLASPSTQGTFRSRVFDAGDDRRLERDPLGAGRTLREADAGQRGD